MKAACREEPVPAIRERRKCGAAQRRRRWRVTRACHVLCPGKQAGECVMWFRTPNRSDENGKSGKLPRSEMCPIREPPSVSVISDCGALLHSRWLGPSGRQSGDSWVAPCGFPDNHWPPTHGLCIYLVASAMSWGPWPSPDSILPLLGYFQLVSVLRWNLLSLKLFGQKVNDHRFGTMSNIISFRGR